MLDYVTALVTLKRFEEAAEKLATTEVFFKSIAIDDVKQRLETLSTTIKQNHGSRINSFDDEGSA